MDRPMQEYSAKTFAKKSPLGITKVGFDPLGALPVFSEQECKAVHGIMAGQGEDARVIPVPFLATILQLSDPLFFMCLNTECCNQEAVISLREARRAVAVAGMRLDSRQREYANAVLGLFTAASSAVIL